jgi:ADP-L-glycero-D-manno-heptose 6-epimerase
VKEGRPQPAQSVGLKFFNVFGPGEAQQGPAWPRWCSTVTTRSGARGVVRLFKSHRPGYTDGGQLRDFIYVHDLVRVMTELSERPSVSGRCSIWAPGRPIPSAKLPEALFAALNLPPRSSTCPCRRTCRAADQYFTQATMAKLARAGVPDAPTPLAEAVADYAKRLQ